MTIWTPDIAGGGAKAALIAEAIAADIASGRLPAGERLPPQRDLAYRLGISVGTVTRAYAEAERRGLVAATVGRGTYVRDKAQVESPFGIAMERAPDEVAADGVIDLSANLSRCSLRQSVFDEALAALQGVPGSSELIEYQPAAGMRRHREAGASWIGRAGIDADPDRILICQGAQQVLAVVFSALTRPGDTVLTEALTFPPVKLQAEMLHFRLHGVAMDEYGLSPEALDAAARTTGAKVLYTIPTHQNPTGGIMPEERRREIARIAEAHDLRIVEDDVYGAMAAPCPPPITRFAPDRSWYVTSVSKCLAPGLRVGYLLCPNGETEPFAAKIRAMGWVNPPLCAEIAALWIRDGTADRLIEWHRRDRKESVALARTIFSSVSNDINDAPHLWLELPDPWRGSELAAESLRRGVRIAEGAAFSVGRDATVLPGRHAVRISLNAARNRDELETGLRIIASCLKSPPSAGSAIL